MTLPAATTTRDSDGTGAAAGERASRPPGSPSPAELRRTRPGRRERPSAELWRPGPPRPPASVAERSGPGSARAAGRRRRRHPAPSGERASVGAPRPSEPGPRLRRRPTAAPSAAPVSRLPAPPLPPHAPPPAPPARARWRACRVTSVTLRISGVSRLPAGKGDLTLGRLSTGKAGRVRGLGGWHTPSDSEAIAGVSATREKAAVSPCPSSLHAFSFRLH